MARTLPARPSRSSKLPAETSSFVGRRHELTLIRELLAEHPLVTLFGVGGVGKTRLAIRASRDLQRAFRNGVHFVDLAGLTDHTLLVQTVGTALGLRDDSTLPGPQRLVQQLAGQQLLIVLDNCEHLIEDCALLVDTLLAGCPDIRVLATSRTALQITAECTMPLAPLSVPDAEHERGPEAVLTCEAVRLFVERAAASLPNFEITPQNWETVAELCRRLDGIPLAIELTAVRLRSLTPQQILDGLTDRFRLLSQGSRAARPRQRTLRALMGWSFDLLSEEARLLWARTSVFAHSFELDAAERVCSGGDLAAEDVLDLVAELIDKSVLLRDEQSGRVRYRLLETVREYGLHRLRMSGELDAVRERHRDFYVWLCAQAADALAGGGQIPWYHRLRAEHPNLRAALDHCLTSPDEARVGLELTAHLRHYWVMVGAFGEGRGWVQQLLAVAPPCREQIGGLTVAGRLAVLQSDATDGLALLHRARDLCESTGDGTWLADIAHGDGLALLLWAEPGGAVAHFDEALAAHRAAGNAFEVMLALIQSATAQSLLGNVPRAFDLCEECLEISRVHDDRWCAGIALGTEALIRWHWGEHTRAHTLARECLIIKETFGDKMGMAIAMDVIAWVTQQQGHHARAAQLLGAVEAAWRSVGVRSLFRHVDEEHTKCAERACDALGEHAFNEAIDRGRRLDFDAAVTLALHRGTRSPAPSPKPRHDDLTTREREIAELVTLGMSNRDIAARLVISPRTAEKHVEKILTKLGLSSRTQIGVWVATGHAAVQPRGEPSQSHVLGA